MAHLLVHRMEWWRARRRRTGRTSFSIAAQKLAIGPRCARTCEHLIPQPGLQFCVVLSLPANCTFFPGPWETLVVFLCFPEPLGTGCG